MHVNMYTKGIVHTQQLLCKCPGPRECIIKLDVMVRYVTGVMFTLGYYMDMEWCNQISISGQC